MSATLAGRSTTRSTGSEGHAAVTRETSAAARPSPCSGWARPAWRPAPPAGQPVLAHQPSTGLSRPHRPGPSQPQMLASRDGVLDVRLTAAPGVRLAGHDTSAWGFNGTSPGPTLRVRPGDLLRVRLVNHIDQPTNLHTHGLHVSPHGNGDNPFVTIDPGDGFDYAIRIPADHPAGTFWYHPHHHGTVADQIFAGLVGALLVEGETDLPVTDDLVLLVTDTTLDGSGHVAAPSRDGQDDGPRRRAGARQRPAPTRHHRRTRGDAAMAGHQRLHLPGAGAAAGGPPAHPGRPRRGVPAGARRP